MTMTVSDAGRRGGYAKNARLDKAKRLAHAKMMNAAKASKRQAEIDAANKRALETLNAKVEGHK